MLCRVILEGEQHLSQTTFVYFTRLFIQSELNALTEPLNAELDNLEKQEKDYDLEYSELFESQNEEDVERLANITAEMVEISKRKLEIKKKLDEYEPEF